MKIILLVLLMIPLGAGAQANEPARAYYRTDTSRPYKKPAKPIRYGVWVLPSNVHKIYGAAVGALPMNIRDNYLEIDGVNIDVCPLGAFFVPGCIMYAPYMAIMYRPIDTSGIHTYHKSVYTVMNGVEIRATGGMPVDRMNGVSLTGAVNISGTVNGVIISTVCNETRQLHGVQLSGWGNIASGGKGVQIGIFNRADDCSCVQIGLLNRNGKRLLPLVNWRRRKDKNRANAGGELNKTAEKQQGSTTEMLLVRGK